MAEEQKERNEEQTDEAMDASFTPIEDEAPEENGAQEANEASGTKEKKGLLERMSDSVNEQKTARQEKKEARARERAEKKAERQAEKQRKKEERRMKWEAGRKKRRRILAIVITVLVLILAAGGAVYYHYVQFFGSHFYKGTTINGIDVSYQTVDDVKKEIEKRVAKYVLTIKTKNGSESLSAKDVGWKYVDDQKIDELLASQEPWTWIVRVSHPETYQVSAGTTYDKAKAESAVATLNCLTKEIVDPVDAVLTESTDGVYEIIPETEGNRVDEERLKTVIYQALDTAEESVDIVKNDCYVHPAVYRNDKQLVGRKNDWNKYLSISITYKFGSDTETVNANDLKQYIRDDGSEVVLSQDWINTLIYRWSRKYDTYSEEYEFTSHDGQVVTVPAGGDYGWSLNREKMIQDLTDAIEQGKSGAREPIWLFRAKGWEHDGLTGTYAEVDRAAQKLYLYQNDRLIMETDVVTGGAGSETTPGIFSVDEKKEEQLLDADSEQTASLWLSFYGNEGLCDAPWRSSFGLPAWQAGGSSGCIEVPKDKMQMIYDTLSEGSAIVIY